MMLIAEGVVDDADSNFELSLVASLVAGHKKAPATIHILLMTASDKKMLRIIPVTHRRSKKSIASQAMAMHQLK